MLRGFVPERYCVDKATVIDSRGGRSDSIDLVVYDRHHSPLVFEQQGFRYVPAEAVYAVFEVKQSLNAEYVAYAANKAASVRRLYRTSVAVTDIHGTTPVKKPIHILAGLLTTEIGWGRGSVAEQLRKCVDGLDREHMLDLVCAADSLAFEISRDQWRCRAHAPIAPPRSCGRLAWARWWGCIALHAGGGCGFSAP